MSVATSYESYSHLSSVHIFSSSWLTCYSPLHSVTILFSPFSIFFYSVLDTETIQFCLTWSILFLNMSPQLLQFLIIFTSIHCCYIIWTPYYSTFSKCKCIFLPDPDTVVRKSPGIESKIHKKITTSFFFKYMQHSFATQLKLVLLFQV